MTKITALTKPSANEQFVACIKLFFDILYFQFCSPFRLTFDRNQETCRIVASSWLPQKFICGVVTLTAIISIAGETRNALPTNSKNSRMSLEFCSVFAYALAKFILIKKLWFGQRELVELINYFLKRGNKLLTHDSNWVTNILTKKYGLAMVILESSCTLAIAIKIWLQSGILALATGCDAFTVAGVSRFVEWGKYILFLNSRPTGISEVIVGIFGAAGLFWRTLLELRMDPVLLLASIMAWFQVKRFTNILLATGICGNIRRSEQENKEGVFNVICKFSIHSEVSKWSDVQRMYEAIMRLTNTVNSIFGWMQCYVVLGSVLYYCSTFSKLFVQGKDGGFENWALMVDVAYYFTVTCTNLAVSADVSKKVRNP